MARRVPPKGFGSTDIELITLPKGFKWLRLYSARHRNPLGFGFSASRFSDPRVSLPEANRFAVLYFGSTLKVCFLERVLRDLRNGKLGDIPIPLAELKQLRCAEATTAHPLKLVDLTGDCPVKMGVPTDAVKASSHRLGQRWSVAFHIHGERPDGILYPSRLNGEINLALYHRALTGITVSTIRPFLSYRSAVAALLDEFKVALV